MQLHKAQNSSLPNLKLQLRNTAERKSNANKWEKGGNMVIILRKCLPICKPYMQNCPKLDSFSNLHTGEASPGWQCMKTGAINWVWLTFLVRTKNCWPKWFGEESDSTKADCGLSGNSRSRLWSQRWRRAVRSYCFDLTHTQIPMATQELCI
jgi:hypothetical protein